MLHSAVPYGDTVGSLLGIGTTVPVELRPLARWSFEAGSPVRKSWVVHQTPTNLRSREIRLDQHTIFSTTFSLSSIRLNNIYINIPNLISSF